jgi:aflatoxin B1 aldehyde reductase
MSNQILNTVLGTANFGVSHLLNTSVQGNPQEYVDLLKKHGFKDLDTAKGYGTSEQVLGQLKPNDQGLLIDTKVRSFVPGAHAPALIKKSIRTSLEDLKVKQIHVLYLHAPDRATPFAVTLKAIDEAYREGAFKKVTQCKLPVSH